LQGSGGPETRLSDCCADQLKNSVLHLRRHVVATSVVQKIVLKQVSTAVTEARSQGRS